MLPLDRFLTFIKLNKLFEPTDKVLLAVSGGKDSVLMTHLFNGAGLNFGIAHCNFKLRGEESDADETFVREMARSLDAPCFITSFNTQVFASEEKLSIQMAARHLRYSWFERVRSENQYKYIALAHHKNDTVETVLLNLIRGTGIAGLHGILPKREKLIRPLLFLAREEIDDIVDKYELQHRNDSSNASSKYARNKIRLEVIPKLKELNPRLEDTFIKNGNRFSELERLLNIRVEQLRSEIFKLAANDEVIVELSDLRSLDPQLLLLYELFKPYNFTETVLEDLVQSWNGQPGKVFVSLTHKLVLDRNRLILSPQKSEQFSEVLVNPDASESGWGAYVFKVTQIDSPPENIPARKNSAFLDFDLLHFPLRLRHWKEGDYFYPLGMKGRKKLSDFFTGQKLSLTEKQRVPVLVNGNGEILWVAGFRIDDRYKLTTQTKKVIIFEAKTDDN